MKNILYLSKTMGVGGTEKVVLQLCDGLKNDFNKIVVVSSGGIHEKWLEDNNIRHYKIGSFDDKSPINILNTFKTLLYIIKNEKIDIVHSQHRMGTFYCKILNRFRNFKLIHTAHNTFYDKKIMTRFAFRNISIVAVGKQVKRNLTDFYGVNHRNIEVIYNGIKKEAIKEKIVKEIDSFKKDGMFVVGNIGRLSEQKGIDYFLKSIPEIVKKEEKIRFIIVGDGELNNELKEMAKSLKIQKYVKFLGYRDDILNIINQLDLVVLSSLWEGLPLTPIETFMMGKTIVATDVDGTGEIVSNKFNGILIKPKSSEEITNSIIEIYKFNELRERLENNALETYKSKFTYDKFINNYRKFYLKIK
ncbi:glycosyltransferase family 4 protein [Clostridium perfringens]|uniref:glycosyltransferase family 4 protein n=1 Tax=Clostridium perfringens TaxID=1502 RepID=UPI002FCCE37E